MLVGDASALVTAWLAMRGDAPGPLLCPIDQAGRITIARLSGGAIEQIVSKRCAEAGIRRHRPHDLRHTVATELHQRGVPLREIQEIMGHVQITTTQRYMHVSDGAKRRAAELLSIEF